MDVIIRLGDIRGCKEELSTELQKNEETNHLEETLRHLDYAYSLQVSFIVRTTQLAGCESAAQCDQVSRAPAAFQV